VLREQPREDRQFVMTAVHMVFIAQPYTPLSPFILGFVLE
jgi:hypothetical protein